MKDDKTIGRKVIRENQTRKRKHKNRLQMILAITLGTGMAIGIILTSIYFRVTNIQANDDIIDITTEYGSGYDGKIYTGEVLMDWSGDEYDFTPLDCGLDEETQKFTFYLCKAYDVDFCFVMAVMQHESDFQFDLISSTNDYGLMQINQCNHEWLTDAIGVTDYLDKEQNIRAGVFVLRKLFEEYEEPDLVLMAYNMGASGAENLWNKGIYSTPYVDDILLNQAKFQSELEGKEGTTDDNTDCDN